MCKQKVKNYEVNPFNSQFVKDHKSDYEHFIALQSREIIPYLNDAETFEGLVCVKNASNKCKRIYRKTVGSTAFGLDGQHVMMGARSMKQLNLPKGGKVIIKPTNWFCYLWNHYDSTIRHPFRCAIIIGIISIAIGVLSLFSGCHCGCI